MLVLWEEEKTTVKNIGTRLHLDSGTLTPLLKCSEVLILRLEGNSIPNFLACFFMLAPEQPYFLPISS